MQSTLPLQTVQYKRIDGSASDVSCKRNVFFLLLYARRKKHNLNYRKIKLRRQHNATDPPTLAKRKLQHAETHRNQIN